MSGPERNRRAEDHGIRRKERLCLKSPESGENVPCIWSLFDWPALETASREIVAQGPDDRLDVDNDIWYGERPRKTGIYRVKRRVSIVRYFGICEEETARKEAF